MTALRNVILSVSALSIAQLVFMILAPQKYRQAVKLVLSLCSVAIIASGIIKIDLDEIALNLSPKASQTSFNNEYALVLSELDSMISEYIASLLEEIDIEAEKVSVTTTIDDSLCISISKVSILLSREYESYKNVITKMISDKIGDIPFAIAFVEV